MSHELRCSTPDIPEYSQLQCVGFRQGEVNTSYILEGLGNRYVWRVPRKDFVLYDQNETDYGQTGFLASGGSYRFRNIQEQSEFMLRTHSLGLNNIVPIYSDESGMLLPYIEGETLDQYLLRGEVNILPKVLDNLTSAHRLGIVYGDRWVNNTLVTNDGNDFVEIDFDIEIDGPYAKEFEMAQFLYHTLHFARDKQIVLSLLNEYFNNSQMLREYNVSMLNQFLIGYSNFLEGKENSGMIVNMKGEVELLIQSISLYGGTRRDMSN